MITPIPFGKRGNAFARPTTVNGETGWFTLPYWFQTQPNPNNSFQLMASPTGNFSVNPVYYCVIDDSGQNYAFQDLLLSKIAGTSGNYNYYGVQWCVQA